jgi:pimeloyl-ACP methyl ester carboxylesterase
MRPTNRANRCNFLELSDGRRLAYTATGPADGVPVIYCHGAIGTPVGGTVDLDLITEQLGVRYITPFRPGLGASDPKPGRTILDFADDVSELADALELERFAVVGVSAGGPYALALAHQLGDRVSRVALVSSLSPFCPPHETHGLRKRIRWALRLLDHAPALATSIGNVGVAVIRKRPQLLMRAMSMHAAPAEQERLAGASERSAASTAFLDAAEQGVGGMLHDYRIYAGGWGFAPAAVDTEVHLWHGVSDPLVPIDHALQLALALPNCRVFFDPDEGHHFFRSSIGRILTVLVGDRSVCPGERVTTTIDGAQVLVSLSSRARRRREVARAADARAAA